MYNYLTININFTPLGVIYVKHVKKDDGNVVSTVKAPDGIKVVSK